MEVKELTTKAQRAPRVTKKFKAYRAEIEGEEWCILVHGETPGKAKRRFLRVCPDPWLASPEYWTEIRLRRVRDFDDLPITWENYQESWFVYTDPETGEAIREDGFENWCDCPICRASIHEGHEGKTKEGQNAGTV